MRRGIAHVLVFAVGGFVWAGKHLAPQAPTPRPHPHVPYDPTEVERSVRFLEARALSDPQGATGLAMLASAYLRRQSEGGDPDDLLRAEASARRSLSVRSHNNPIGHWALAKALMGRHAFTEAHAVALKLGDGALAAECDIELGNYDRARQLLAEAASRRPNDPVVRVLQARLWELVGKVQLAEDAYRSALQLIEAHFEASAPSRAWFHDRLATFLATQGRFTAAQSEFEAARDAYPDDRHATLGLAQLAADQGNTAEAKKLAATVALPEASMLLYKLGDTSQWERITSEASGRHVHGRALALFFADTGRNSEEAVRLMRADGKQRQDIYTADALAWSLYRAGQKAEAQTYARLALATGTRDRLIVGHAQQILSEKAP
ncbi:tetratricopeptide repeat protein [Armatimonas rosea]|uniref:Tfp pilus assembly protein PilF n=1 Tax=Armatimonas rosea TaxID=685828 RepID=A0A7W9SLM6_ARMRO|nr:Tfp pilus assembly protein PilF [Armatimonas rosea]